MMKKKWKTRLSLLLCLVLMNTLPMPGGVLTQLFEKPTYAAEEEEEYLLRAGENSVHIVVAGDSGIINGITYTIDSDCNMTISGSGVIPDNTFKNWKEIKKIVIGKEITEIGNYAFSQENALDIKSITSLSFEEGSQLEKIGTSAFSNCSIKELSLPEGLETIAGLKSI